MKIENINITIISDNNSYIKGIETSWGFSCLVNTGKESILFDTGGCGSILLSNMKKLGLSPKKIGLVVISHSHWDHSGGLFDFLKMNSNVKVFIPKSFSDKFTWQIKALGAKAIKVSDRKKIARGIYLSGVFGNKVPEQSLIIEDSEGGFLLTGCAHPGIVEIVKNTSISGHVTSVLGGFHFMGMSDAKVTSVASQLKSLGIKKVFPMHCTGKRQSELLLREFGMPVRKIGAGLTITLERK